MNFRWKSIIELIFQYEITYIKILKSKDDVRNLFLSKSSEKWYVNFSKIFKIKSSNDTIHLISSFGTGRSTNHFYISFTANNENETNVKIFSRIEYFYLISEIVVMFFAVFWFIRSLLEQNIFGILLFIAVIIFILFFNGIAKMTRKERVNDLLNVLKR